MISNIAFLSSFLDARNGNLLNTKEKIHNCYHHLMLKSDAFEVLSHKQFVMVPFLIDIALIVGKNMRIFNKEKLKFCNERKLEVRHAMDNFSSAE